MLRSKAPVWLLLAFSQLLFVDPVQAARCPERCPESCTCVEPSSVRYWIPCRSCYCPPEDGMDSPCSWAGPGGTEHSFEKCLDTLPTGFDHGTKIIYIKHLRSSTILDWSFPNLLQLQHLRIYKSNVSAIQHGAFRGLQSLKLLYLAENRISNLVPDVFLGLKNLEELYLSKNNISVVPKHTFRGLSRLTKLYMDQNQLTSVPVDALLLPTKLERVNLRTNNISFIDNNVKHLQQNKTKQLLLGVPFNKWHCDEKLRWFICNLSRLRFISGANFLTCASPANFKGKALLSRGTKICQTVTNGLRAESFDTASEVKKVTEIFVSKVKPTGRLEVTESTGHEETSSVAVIKTIATNDTIPTHEGYTESPNDVPVSQHTKEEDQIVIILGVDPITHQEDNSSYLLAMSGAVVMPLLLVLASVGVIFVYKRWRGPANPDQPAGADNDHESSGTEGTERIEPYAVAYAHPAELQASNGLSSSADIRPNPAPNQTHNDTIQPYAVAYTEDEGPDPEIKPYAVAYAEDKGPDTEIKPYAVATAEDLAQNDKIEIPLYAVGGPDAPRDAEVDSAPLENNTDQQSTVIKTLIDQSEAEPMERDDVDTEPEYPEEEGENGKQSTSQDMHKGPYVVEEENMSQRASRIYGEGLQPTGSEEHGPSHVLYNPADGQLQDLTSTPSALYGEDQVDTAPSHEP
ncbi:hypothetical protein Bbelb_301470 [Branchiostoma belcheri]|nr:hypothetical protein Bbelb_301470 [Branchiostoma belcheri]